MPRELDALAHRIRTLQKEYTEEEQQQLDRGQSSSANGDTMQQSLKKLCKEFSKEHQKIHAGDPNAYTDCPRIGLLEAGIFDPVANRASDERGSKRKRSEEPTPPPAALRSFSDASPPYTRDATEDFKRLLSQQAALIGHFEALLARKAESDGDLHRCLDKLTSIAASVQTMTYYVRTLCEKVEAFVNGEDGSEGR
ncbi:MAG: hypothetical protein M1826_004925 [Phylliscum demangeonii]|nr:MAG: hypothetical protein M1826_004925 [Phylliscum demangeonii]